MTPAGDDGVPRFAARVDPGLRTDSESGIRRFRSTTNCTTGRFYGYGNREMVQRDEGVWFHPA